MVGDAERIARRRRSARGPVSVEWIALRGNRVRECDPVDVEMNRRRERWKVKSIRLTNLIRRRVITPQQ